MRKAFRIQENSPEIELGYCSITDIKFDPRSRDSVTRVLAGLQCAYQDTDFRKEIINEIKSMVCRDDKFTEKGRKGLDFWSIFVLGMLRLVCNWSYDMLENMANNHRDIRRLIGLNDWLDADKKFSRTALHDNLTLLDADGLSRISQKIVQFSHKELGVSEIPLKGRCDSFVLLSNVHFPTDLNLLFDCVRKCIELAVDLAIDFGRSGWREHKSLMKKVKRVFRTLCKMRHSRSKDESKKLARVEEIKSCCEDYLTRAEGIFIKVESLIFSLPLEEMKNQNVIQILYFIKKGRLLCDQLNRRLLNEEKIHHAEKIFSVFEPYTEWIVKGKAGVSQELGVRFCIVEDQHGFLLNQRMMYGEVDKEMVVDLMEDTKSIYKTFCACSFDKGFHSAKDCNGLTNRDYIELLDITAYLPVQGRPNKEDRERQSQKEFRENRKQHAAVESAINSLEHHGLNRCPDKGKEAFSRYAAAACCGFNLHRLGSIILRQRLELLQAA
jgi:hypothetical protein